MRISPVWSRIGLCSLLGVSGLLHLYKPRPYRHIIPAPLRRHAAPLVYWSGIAELVCVALLTVPGTRRLGAWCAATLMVVVFPANVQMALDSRGPSRRRSTTWVILAWLRLPLQVPLVLWAWRQRGC